jgi:2-C-methyl-D-erythritol 2,4-cyclodiphosphate synthase
MRVGLGFDAHRFGGEGPIVLGGVVFATDRGLEGTSDADVASHAVADALLGAAALGDLGAHFPASDERWNGADSMALLERVVALLADAGQQPSNVDVTVVAQSVRISPHREEMRHRLADVLAIDISAVSVKATTTDHLGAIGRDEGIAALAVATITER